MAAENTPDAEYQGVLDGLENFSERFSKVVGSLDVESIKQHSEKVSTQSQDQMDLLNGLKKRIGNLNQEIQSKRESNKELEDGVNIGLKAQKKLLESKLNLELRLDKATASNKELKANLDILSGEVEKRKSALLQARRETLEARNETLGFKTELEASRASDKTRINFLETTIAAGGDSSKTLTEEVQRLESVRQVESRALEACQKELVEARNETQGFKTELEASRAEAVTIKSRVADLESGLADATNAGSAASVVNADLKAELSTLQALYNDLQNESRKITIRNELLAKEILDHYKSGEEEEQAEGAEEEVGDHGPIPDPSPVSIDEVVYIPVVTFVPNNPNAIFNYIMENVYLNDLIPPKFKSTLTKTRGQGILLTEQTLRDLINRLRTGPLAAFSGNETYKHQLQNYAFWGPNETVSYADVARRHLNLQNL